MKRFRPTTKIHEIMLLIVFAVVVYALVNNLSVIGDVFWFITDLLDPLIIGGILAFFLNVPMRKLEELFEKLQRKRGKKVRHRLNSTVSLIITYVVGFLLFLSVLYILIPQLVQSIPGIVSSVEAAMPRFFAFLDRHQIDATQLKSLLSSFNLRSIMETAIANYQAIISTSLSAVSSVVTVLTLAITGFVISIYILANKRKLLAQSRKVLYAYVKKPIADKAMEIASLTNRTYTNFIAGQCVEAMILGCLFFITMSILRLPFAPVISVFIAVTALIPYVGAFLGCVLGALLIVTVSPMKALIFIVTFLILQQLENQLIYPKVVGNSVGLSALWILVSVFVGGKLGGIVGMLFSIPLTSVLYSLVRANVSSRLSKKQLVVSDDAVTEAAPAAEPEADPSDSKES